MKRGVEMEAIQTSKGSLLLQTLVAMVLAFVVYMVVATVAGMAIYFVQTLLTVVRPGIIAFFAMVIGSVIGMTAARKACDTVLRGYSGKAVFIMFAALAAAALAAELFLVPMQLNQINSLGQLAAGIITAFVYFWKNEAL
ncbi:hypothetical protein FJV80_04260 [Mesorhizobium sp. WSM4310]|uniref:hypothetical protein n=1 Tax=Mesorhizobium sp. WSM4310 TaxID=2589883 RepID=UPI00115E127C|nr:hypothetical protein [Mesorhizobium sp. WSM4310]TRC91141.1 hypothetical protein FJV80_04260 [Mesorhizobium sp. WSM4310]